MADSIILATARAYEATLWTQDSDFQRVEGVQYIPKAVPWITLRRYTFENHIRGASPVHIRASTRPLNVLSDPEETGNLSGSLFAACDRGPKTVGY